MDKNILVLSNISKSYNFNVGENEFEILTKYLKDINTDEI